MNPEAEESNGYLLITDLVPHARMRSAACFRAASGYRHESVASVREECVNNPIQGVAYCGTTGYVVGYQRSRADVAAYLTVRELPPNILAPAVHQAAAGVKTII